MTYVKDTFSGTGFGTPIVIKDGIVELAGTFSATVQILIDAIGDGTFAPATDSTGAALSLTMPGSLRLNNGVPCTVKCQVTAYVSGTVSVAIKAL